MASIQNLTRKQGTYYFRKLVRIGSDQPFRLRLSLKTTNIRQARRRASGHAEPRKQAGHMGATISQRGAKTPLPTESRTHRGRLLNGICGRPFGCKR